MGKTIFLSDVFDDFILAGKFPRDPEGVESDVVAGAIAVWRPDMAALMPSKRIARIMCAHPWIDRVRLAGGRYAYMLASDKLPEINAAMVARRSASAKPQGDADGL